MVFKYFLLLISVPLNPSIQANNKKNYGNFKRELQNSILSIGKSHSLHFKKQAKNISSIQKGKLYKTESNNLKQVTIKIEEFDMHLLVLTVKLQLKKKIKTSKVKGIVKFSITY